MSTTPVRTPVAPSASSPAPGGEGAPTDFIRARVEQDLRQGKHSRVVTRFPPEPNGYLHIGHAKSICLNFGLPLEYGGVCHLRFDDTNPLKEDVEYVEAIERDVRWLGFDWQGQRFAASDYFGQMYAWAQELIRRGKAYVCHQTEAEMRATRGTVTEAGSHSPWRDRPAEESLRLLEAMRVGELDEGAATLRAKIDMASPNMKMRDPAIYRIRKAHHHATGDAWCIYPLYDYAHCLSDAIEGITHSICTLEFENNRELYDWYLDQLPVPAHPVQIEFARLNLTWMVMSKRFLLQLVQDGRVNGWDDPRMPTLAGLRRKGVPPEALRAFCEAIGVAKTNSTVEIEMLEHHIRDHLNRVAPRVLAVLNPLEVLLDNIEEDVVLEAPALVGEGSRPLTLSKRIYIERDDFAEVAPKGWHRLSPGQAVRLRYAGILQLTAIEKDGAGEVIRLRATLDRGSEAKVKGTLHWLSATAALPAEFRLYDRLFTCEKPGGEDGNFLRDMNPDSLRVARGWVDPVVAEDAAGTRYQFERMGYFASDTVDSRPGALVFNRIVPLKDSWKGASKPMPAAEVTAAPARPQPAAGDKAPTVDSPEALRLITLGLGAPEARRIAGDAALTAFFEAALPVGASARGVGSWLVNELIGRAGGGVGGRLGPLAFGTLVQRVEQGVLTGSAGKTLLAALLEQGGEPDALIESLGLRASADTGALDAAIEAAITGNPDAVTRFRGGQEGLLGLFVGQVMKAMRGTADAKVVTERLRARLG